MAAATPTTDSAELAKELYLDLVLRRRGEPCIQHAAMTHNSRYTAWEGDIVDEVKDPSVGAEEEAR